MIPENPCKEFALRVPNNGLVSACVDSNGTMTCKVSCNAEYYFYNAHSPLIYTCTPGLPFENTDLGTYVPDCMGEFFRI